MSKSIWWYSHGKSPDEMFFKYGQRKPSEYWCIFSSEELGLRHAYKSCIKFLNIEEEDCLPENCTIDEIKKFLEINNWFNSEVELIEIQIDL